MKDAQEFIRQVLEDLDCRGISVQTRDIHCQCPFHRPRRNVTAFGISYTEEEKGFPYHCLSCGERGNLVKLVSFATGRSYKRAAKLVRKQVSFKEITTKNLMGELVKLNKTSSKALKGQGKVVLPPRSKNQKAMVRYLEKRARKARGYMRIDYIINKYGLYYCSEGRMAGRIIMPIRINGEIVGINDRAVDDSVRNKSLHVKGQSYNELLHGLDESLGKSSCVLVEGSFDMYQGQSIICRDNKLNCKYGIVDNMGTKFSEIKLAYIVENFDELVIMFDNQRDDKGKHEGLEGSIKWYREARDHIAVRNITTSYPEGKDPGVCGKRDWKQALKSKGYVPQTYLSKIGKSQIWL